VWTSRGNIGDLPAVGLACAEDPLGEEEFEVWAVGIDPDARVYEVHEPGDWGWLAATHPTDVTASRWHDWSRWTGREGRWILPDWRSVAAQWDGVHVSVAGYLSTAGMAVESEGGSATLLAGWDADQTLIGKGDSDFFPPEQTRFFNDKDREVLKGRRLVDIPEEPIQELLIALAGPAVNVAIAVVLLVLTGSQAEPTQLAAVESGKFALADRLTVVNLFLALFNMIPAFPMDGGRVLRAVLAIGLGQQRATRIAAFIGQAIAGVFVLGGIFQADFFLAFIGLFVFLGASQEVAFQTRREAIAGHTAQEAMITKYETLAPQDTLGRAAELLLASHQHDFPVLDAWNRVAGVLPRAKLLEGLARSGRETSVLEVMDREPVHVAPGTELEAVLQILQTDPAAPLLVIADGTLLGMITFENLAEFIVVARQIAR
jgi:CBS domain-containing protein